MRVGVFFCFFFLCFSLSSHFVHKKEDFSRGGGESQLVCDCPLFRQEYQTIVCYFLYPSLAW